MKTQYFSTCESSSMCSNATGEVMNTSNSDGLTADNSQPAKTLSKYIVDFTASCISLAIADGGSSIALSLLLLQVALPALTEKPNSSQYSLSQRAPCRSGCVQGECHD